MYRKDFLSITDLTAPEIWRIFFVAKLLKQEIKASGKFSALLAGQTLVMIFEKPSLRTRLSFEIGMTQLGGHAVSLAPGDIGLGVRESVADVARVASGMGQLVMARTFRHETIQELAAHASVPVINGLSDLEHPCQILADFLTIYEIKKRVAGLKLAFIGDSENNITHSLALASGLLGVHFVAASPKGYWMNPAVVAQATQLAQKHNGSITQTDDPLAAVRGADIVYTDTWISMGDEAQKQERLRVFAPYQVTTKHMSLAQKDAIFMHDLPAYRGHEVAADVIDGQQSVVFAQAENRLHVQKALVAYLLQLRYDL